MRVVVVGGGIAGVSAAWAFAAEPDGRPRGGVSVTLVEAEATLAHHTTGRSAAQLIENYGAQALRPLTTTSLPFFHEPPEGLTDAPLLTERALLTVGTVEQDEAIERTLAEGRLANPTITEIDGDEARRRAPLLAPTDGHRYVLEPESADIDVAGLHQAFVRGFRAAGGTIATVTRLDAARANGSGWRVETTTGPIDADIVVNAAGAWGDVVATAAGVEPVGLTPLRRTAFMVRSPWDHESAGWPLVADAEHTWYLKPDGAQFLCSPADETPSAPMDAKPEELDVAIAIERINSHTTLDIRTVASSWAGLRTFSPDRSMVLGPDPDHPGFVWCVGQGGTGIQTAPGAARCCASMALGEPLDERIDPGGLTVDRFR